LKEVYGSLLRGKYKSLKGYNPWDPFLRPQYNLMAKGCQRSPFQKNTDTLNNKVLPHLDSPYKQQFRKWFLILQEWYMLSVRLPSANFDAT
jgi:hypothetical protein